MATQTREEILTQYEEAPQLLSAALEGISGENLDLSRCKEKWTIRQIVHHIVDAEDLWETCIKAALGNSGCTFDISWYIPDNKCAQPLEYDKRPVNDGIELFTALRRHVIELVKDVPGSWERYVQFTRNGMPEEKKFTVGDIIGWQLRHTLLHLEQIRQTREVHGI